MLQLKVCARHNLSYSKNCSRCLTEKVVRRRIKLKEMALTYKGNKCQNCGYDKSKAALVFHHIIPAEKEFGISQKGYTRSWERVQKELDKCVLLCANCHAEEHERIDNIGL